MPLKKGKSKKTVSKNIKELTEKTPSKKRKKAINTIAKKQGISKREAQRRQAIAIALQQRKK